MLASAVAEAGSKGLLQSILHTLDLGRPQPNIAVDVVLMVTLAKGDLTQAERDALELTFAAQAYGDATWPEVIARSEELRDDAPFFTDAREVLFGAQYPDDAPDHALSVAARVATAGAPLAEEQVALLRALAEGLGVSDAHLSGLAPLWGYDAAPDQHLRLYRPAFSDPGQSQPLNLFNAIARAQGEELRILMFKLAAPRDLASLLDDSAHITEVGTLVEMGPHQLRIDAIVDTEQQEWWVRCLAKGEALYPLEHKLLANLVGTLATHQRLAFAYEGQLSPADEDMITHLDASKVIIQAV